MDKSKQKLFEMMHKVAGMPLNENTNYQPNLDDLVGGVFSYDLIKYGVKKSFSSEFHGRDDDIDSSETYKFSLLIPKGAKEIDGLTHLDDIEKLFKYEYGSGSEVKPNGDHTNVYYNFIDKGDDVLINVVYSIGTTTYEP